MEKYVIIIVVTCIAVYVSLLIHRNMKAKKEGPVTGKTIQFKAKDGVNIKAHLYLTADKTKPFMLIFQQAGHSQQEYRNTATQLNKMGFNCLAIHQRSARNIKGSKIKSKKQEDSLRTLTYDETYVDLESALLYLKKAFPNFKTVVWGSSYAATLMFVLASNYPNEVDGIVAFSPDNYLVFNDKTILDYAEGVHCPIFVTAGKKESKACERLHEQIQSEKKYLYIPIENEEQDSLTTKKKNTRKNQYWKILTDFFESIVN